MATEKPKPFPVVFRNNDGVEFIVQPKNGDTIGSVLDKLKNARAYDWFSFGVVSESKVSGIVSAELEALKATREARLAEDIKRGRARGKPRGPIDDAVPGYNRADRQSYDEDWPLWSYSDDAADMFESFDAETRSLLRGAIDAEYSLAEDTYSEIVEPLPPLSMLRRTVGQHL